MSLTLSPFRATQVGAKIQRSEKKTKFYLSFLERKSYPDGHGHSCDHIYYSSNGNYKIFLTS